MKIILSLSLFSLSTVTVLMHANLGAVPSDPVNLVLLILYLLLLPLAMLTGHLGGKISFGG